MSSIGSTSRYCPGDYPVPGYRLVRFLGGGQSGDVWEAEGANTRVAVKIVPLDRPLGQKELRGLARVKDKTHPNLVPIHGFWLKDGQGYPIDYGVVDLKDSDTADRHSVNRKSVHNSLPQRPAELVIAMGLADCSLGDLLEQQSERCLPRDQLVEYMRAAASAIDFLNHNHRVFHCDIKPSNILLVGNSVQVCDFGVASVVREDVRNTRPGYSLAYAPPELAKGDDPHPNSDQYSLAVTYIELRTGYLPYKSETTQGVISAKLTGDVDLSRLSEAERSVAAKALSTNPADRYDNCTSMIADLTAAVLPKPSVCTPFKLEYEVGDTPVFGYTLLSGLGRSRAPVWRARGPGVDVALKIINLDRAIAHSELRALSLVKNVGHPHLVDVHGFWIKHGDGKILGGHDYQPSPDAAHHVPLMNGLSSPLNGPLTETTEFNHTITPDQKAWEPDAPSAPRQDPLQLIIAMTLADDTLANYLQQCKNATQRGLPRAELRRFMSQAAEAIDWLNSHDEQIQHCDIKPSNILLVGNSVKVCDFGLAQARAANTQEPNGCFTPAYAAPELVVNHAPSATTDQYSLAITFVELLTGRLPYPEEGQASLFAAKLSGKLRLRGLTPRERRAVRKATALNPDNRFKSCSAFVAALEPVRTSTLFAASLAVVVSFIAFLGLNWYTGYSRFRSEVNKLSSEPPDSNAAYAAAFQAANGWRYLQDVLNERLQKSVESVSTRTELDDLYNRIDTHDQVEKWIEDLGKTHSLKSSPTSGGDDSFLQHATTHWPETIVELALRESEVDNWEDKKGRVSAIALYYSRNPHLLPANSADDKRLNDAVNILSLLSFWRGQANSAESSNEKLLIDPQEEKLLLGYIESSQFDNQSDLWKEFLEELKVRAKVNGKQVYAPLLKKLDSDFFRTLGISDLRELIEKGEWAEARRQLKELRQDRDDGDTRVLDLCIDYGDTKTAWKDVLYNHNKIAEGQEVDLAWQELLKDMMTERLRNEILVVNPVTANDDFAPWNQYLLNVKNHVDRMDKPFANWDAIRTDLAIAARIETEPFQKMRTSTADLLSADLLRTAADESPEIKLYVSYVQFIRKHSSPQAKEWPTDPDHDAMIRDIDLILAKRDSILADREAELLPLPRRIKLVECLLSRVPLNLGLDSYDGHTDKLKKSRECWDRIVPVIAKDTKGVSKEFFTNLDFRCLNLYASIFANLDEWDAIGEFASNVTALLGASVSLSDERTDSLHPGVWRLAARKSAAQSDKIRFYKRALDAWKTHVRTNGIEDDSVSRKKLLRECFAAVDLSSKTFSEMQIAFVEKIALELATFDDLTRDELENLDTALEKVYDFKKDDPKQAVLSLLRWRVVHDDPRMYFDQSEENIVESARETGRLLKGLESQLSRKHDKSKLHPPRVLEYYWIKGRHTVVGLQTHREAIDSNREYLSRIESAIGQFKKAENEATLPIDIKFGREDRRARMRKSFADALVNRAFYKHTIGDRAKDARADLKDAVEIAPFKIDSPIDRVASVTDYTMRTTWVTIGNAYEDLWWYQGHDEANYVFALKAFTRAEAVDFRYLVKEPLPQICLGRLISRHAESVESDATKIENEKENIELALKTLEKMDSSGLSEAEVLEVAIWKEKLRFSMARVYKARKSAADKSVEEAQAARAALNKSVEEVQAARAALDKSVEEARAARAAWDKSVEEAQAAFESAFLMTTVVPTRREEQLQIFVSWIDFERFASDKDEVEILDRIAEKVNEKGVANTKLTETDYKTVRAATIFQFVRRKYELIVFDSKFRSKYESNFNRRQFCERLQNLVGECRDGFDAQHSSPDLKSKLMLFASQALAFGLANGCAESKEVLEQLDWLETTILDRRDDGNKWPEVANLRCDLACGFLAFAGVERFKGKNRSQWDKMYLARWDKLVERYENALQLLTKDPVLKTALSSGYDENFFVNLDPVGVKLKNAK